MTVPLRGLPGAAVHQWRRSLQLRVAATTLVLSALVTAVLGLVLLNQIRNGLLDAKSRAGLSQLDVGLQHAALLFAGADPHSPAQVRATASNLVEELAGGHAEANPFALVLLSRDNASDTLLVGATPAAIPASLSREVTKQGREAWTYTSVPGVDGSTGPALIAGGPVPSSKYQLYYVFPLTQEEQTLALVKRTMLLAGAAIVALLVIITVVVARQVVRPVRLAAATAERLAAGRLRDRMKVRGEDDLASLATSFNGMAETVERQISQLRELSRVQRRFVADVSHELRTPITTIRMAADLLHEGRADLPPELARSAELLQNQLDRFEALLADLLEISRHDAGAVAIDAEMTDLRPLVARVADGATPIATSRGCELQVVVPEQPVVVEVDARRIERVLRNLVVNAVEHGAGHPVCIRLAGGPGGVAVSVRDHGSGLRPGEASLVFGRFWRADPARARSSGGTGLGLSIALEDARLHGGWLQAWGSPGEGSVFRLTLPWRVGDHVGDSPLPLEPVDEPAPAPEVAGA